MNYKQLGLSNLNVSEISLGTLHFGVYLNDSQSKNLVSYAIDEGINFIDSGPLYGNSFAEEILGKAIINRREKVIISTKVGLSKELRSDGSFGVSVLNLNKKNIRESLENSLRALKTEYIDLFQFHAFDGYTPLEESLSVMNELIVEGKIRAVGASNYNQTELESVLNVISKIGCSPLSTLETHYNIIERKAELDLIPQCVKNNVSLIPYRSLARGLLSGKYFNSSEYPKNSRAADSWRVRKLLTKEVLLAANELEKIAVEKGKTLINLAISWLLSKTYIPSVLVGAKNIEQLSGCISSTKWNLTQDEILLIDKVLKETELNNLIYLMPETFFEK